MQKVISSSRIRLTIACLLPLGIAAFAKLFPGSVQAVQQVDAAHITFFESRVRPVLVTSCYDCHTDSPQGGLRVDSREALLKGGRRGPAIIPGDPDNSLLIKAVSHADVSLLMPKGSPKLRESEIADLKKWISNGAVWPAAVVARNDYLIKAEHKNFWSFQPVSRPAVPSINTRFGNPVDAFLLTRLRASNLSFNPPADKRTWLRRATFDLTGLPPTAKEIADFIADDSSQAYAKVVDRLLSSPRYGERWGRHWLDLSRYSDTIGMIDAGRNIQGWFPYAYTYRDWVIRAFNEDLPYDQFILQQLAADLLPNNDPRNLAALGFLSLSRGGLGVNQHEQIDDKIDVVSRGLMGLTVSCARCHNHKFDPIPTKDYYSLYTIFNNTRTPATLPLLDPKSDNEKWDAEVKAEEQKVEADIQKLRNKRYPELRKLYASAPEIAKSLRGVYQTRHLTKDDELQKFAQEKDFNLYMLKRWRDYFQQAKAGDQVWTLWQRLIALNEKAFKSEAAQIIAAIPKADINQLVLQAISETPDSIDDLADDYGKLLSKYYQEQPFARADEEQLRQVLCGPQAPTNMPFSDYESYRLSTDGQNENQLKRSLDSLTLKHAYRGAPPRAQSVEDVSERKTGYVFLRGKPESKGEQVQPQFLQILSGEHRKPFMQGSGRLELAQAIASQKNPLTARVIVNRIWQHHFGHGLVRTPSDFGTRGETPTHPELLAYLANYLLENNWSIKKLHRLLMLSQAYQQSSSDNPSARQTDPENKLLWRMDRRRLGYEELRDSLLAVSGKLDRTMFGLPVSAQVWPYTYRRTIYSFIDRALVPNDFRVFDFADPSIHTAERSLTTVPQQALFMLNSTFVIEQAKALIGRQEVADLKNTRQRISKLYQLIYGREPSREEVAIGLKFVADAADSVTTENEIRARREKVDGEEPNDWQYGEGEYDDKTDRVKTFQPLNYFINGQWRNSPMPGDPRGSTASLTSKGGSLGDSKEHSAIRRWVAPVDGTVTISGVLEHRFENSCRKCNGVLARVVSNRNGTLAKWEVTLGQTDTIASKAEVKRGDLIDFVVEGGKGTSGGLFKWAVTIIQPNTKANEWDSVRDFLQPSAGTLSNWDRYAQALLAAAEFMIID